MSLADTGIREFVNAVHTAGIEVCVVIGGAPMIEEPRPYDTLLQSANRDQDNKQLPAAVASCFSRQPLFDLIWELGLDESQRFPADRYRPSVVSVRCCPNEPLHHGRILKPKSFSKTARSWFAARRCRLIETHLTESRVERKVAYHSHPIGYLGTPIYRKSADFDSILDLKSVISDSERVVALIDITKVSKLRRE